MFFLENHGDESMRRFKMIMKMWFLGFKIILLSFLYISGEFGNKILGLGKHLIGFGRPWIDHNHSLRKNMKSTWLMKTHFVRCFLRKLFNIIPIIFINNLSLIFFSKRSTLKILVFRALSSRFRVSPLDQELVLEKNYNG